LSTLRAAIPAEPSKLKDIETTLLEVNVGKARPETTTTSSS
jgi:hypothetical protein